MTRHSILVAVLCGVSSLTGDQRAHAAVSADAELVMTITLNDIFLIESDDTGVSAFDDFAIEVNDFGVNTQTFGGGSPSNPSGAVGTDSASETVFFNGDDASDPEFSAYDTGLAPGDTIVLTQSVEAVASSPGATFFSQVNSEVSLYFDSYGNDDQRFLFDFDVYAELTGELDLSTMAGSALVIAEGDEVNGVADSTLVGDPNDFTLFAGESEYYYDIAAFSSTNALIPVSGTDGPINIPVEFAPGDNQFTITFRSTLLVNATTDPGDPASGLAGDYNNDGAVDAADYTLWRDALQLGGAIQNETASPGVIDQADYDAWSTNFGAVVASAAEAIPEAAASSLFLTGLLVCPRRRRLRPTP